MPSLTRREACPACGRASGNRSFKAREMMVGLREEFDYLECSSCGSLWIAAIPADLKRFYSNGYYSHLQTVPRSQSFIVRFLKRRRSLHTLGGNSLLGRWTARRYGVPDMFTWLRRLGVKPDDRILDVGSGTGELLLRLAEFGLSSLTGIDPNISTDLRYPNGVTILKLRLEEATGAFDRVMLHHSFEHLPDPRATLMQINRLLKPSGSALIRTPVAGSHAWKIYGPDWVQLDAPRHLFIPSESALRQLAGETGFEVEAVEYDSTPMQFWGSEQYRRNIPLTDPRSFSTDASKAPFTPQQIQAFEKETDRLNAAGQGDQAAFYLNRGKQ